MALRMATTRLLIAPARIVYFTAGGKRYHDSPTCPWLRDGQIEARKKGYHTHPIRRVTKREVVLNWGRTPCLGCLPREQVYRAA